TESPPSQGTSSAYIDVNGNGQDDGGEPSASVSLSDGSFSITGVRPGSFTLRALATRHGFTNDLKLAVPLTQNTSGGVASADLGVVQATLRCSAFLDVNRNGAFDTGEQVLQTS